VKLWHVGTGQELLSLCGSLGLPESMAWCVAFSPVGRALAGGFSHREPEAEKPWGQKD
jgi:hypothetical protein